MLWYYSIYSPLNLDLITEQDSLTLQFLIFFVRNKNGSAHNSWQDRWRSSWHCSESKTYRGTQCIYWKPFSSDLCLKHKIIVKNDLLSLMVIQKSTLNVQILNCLPSSNAQLDGRLSEFLNHRFNIHVSSNPLKNKIAV